MKIPKCRMKTASVCLIACLIAAILTAAVSALKITRDADGVAILNRVDPDLLVGQIDRVVDCFHSPEVTWTGSSQTTELSASAALPFGDESIFEGTRALLVTDHSYNNGQGVGILRSFEDTLPDFTESRFFTLTVCLPEQADYTVTVSLRSSLIDVGQSQHRLSYDKSVTLSGNGWYTLLFDISAFQGRTGIREIECFVKSSAARYAQPYSVAFDAIGFCSSPAPTAALRFLSENYLGTGCQISYGETMQVSVAGSTASFGTQHLPTLLLGGENALCVTLVNQAGFRTLTCTYTDAESGAVRDISRDLDTTAQSLQYCYFPIQADSISEVSFRLSGGSGGQIVIHSISPVSWHVPGHFSLGTLSTCRIDQTKAYLEVVGRLNEGVLLDYPTAKLALYEMTASQTLAQVMSGQAHRLATQSLTDAFTFRVPTTSASLTKSFCVALIRGEEILPIGETIHIENPEILAAAHASLPETDSKKGVTSLQGTSVYDGIAYTTLSVPLEKLITLDRTAFTFATDGVSYYYQAEFLTELDRQITLCRQRGIRALLVLTASPSEDAALNRILLHPSAAVDASFCAFNTATEEGVRYLRAAVNLLAQRYAIREGDLGGVLGFAVGQNVNHTAANYSLGNVTLLTFVREYATALRLVHNSAQAVCPAFAAYASLDYHWNGENSRRAAARFGARQTLDLLNHLITLQGDFDWQLAFDPYSDGEYYAFEDTDADMSAEAARVTLANLEVLTSYITKPAFYYDRQYRSILLLEQTSPTSTLPENETVLSKQSADYVCGYYKISTRNFPLVKALIVGHDVSYNDTFRYIDTDRSAQVTAYALELLGVSDWSAHLTAFDPSAVVVRQLKENYLTHMTPSSIVGQIPLWSFEKQGQVGDWQAGNGTLTLTSGITLGDDYFLSAAIEPPADPGDYCEVFVRPDLPYDFTSTPYLRFPCQISGLPESITSLTIEIAVFSGDDCLRAVGTLQSGQLETLVVDMNDFSERGNVDCIRILFQSEESENIDTLTLLIGQIDGLSEQYADDDLKDRFEQDQGAAKPSAPTRSNSPDIRLTVFLASVIVVALTLEILYILLRMRRNDA